MKTSLKIKGLFVLAMSLFCMGSYAQSTPAVLGDPSTYDQGFKLGLGLNAGYMTDDLYDWALGGDVRLQYDFTRRTSITLTTGFTNLFIGDDIKDIGFIPVKAGFKYFFWEDQFYALGEIGAGFPVTNDYSGAIDNTLILSPGVGYATKYIDISLRYEHYNNFPTSGFNSNGDQNTGVGQVALRLAYGFRL